MTVKIQPRNWTACSLEAGGGGEGYYHVWATGMYAVKGMVFEQFTLR